MNKTQQCSDCGFELQPGFRFCPGCGNQIINSTINLSDILQASRSPIHIDKLVELTGQPVGGLLAELFQKELTGEVKQSAGAMFEWAIERPPIEPTSIQEKKTKSDDASNVDSPPSSGVTIEFRYSSSQTYEFAVQEASKFPTYKEFGSDKKKLHRVTVSIDELESLANLVDFLKGYRNRAVYVDGVKSIWDNVFSFMWCLAQKRESFKPELYCFGYGNTDTFNVFGCIHAGMPFYSSADWLCYGKWLNDEGDWEFDKERIRFELLKKLHYYKHCPALDLSKVEDVLIALPTIVNPLKDKNWRFVESYSDSPSTGFRVKIEKHGMEWPITAKGVAPKGNVVVIEINKKLKFKIPTGSQQTE